MTRNPTRSTVPAWVEIYNEDVHGQQTDKHIDPPLPTARPDQNKGNHSLKRRISQDGFVHWVDEKHDRVSKLPVFMRKRADRPGRRWDHLRTAEPVIMGLGYRAPDEDPYARWRDFIQSSNYGRNPDEEYEVVPQNILDQQMPGLNKPVRTPLHPLDSTKRSRKKTWIMRFWNFVLRHPIAPLIFRLVVLITTIAALALAIKIFEREQDNSISSKAEHSQALVAIVVDVVAIPYILYMTWDEYTGKPLGLRHPVQKVSLTLLDLVFIVFKSASTALAFEALVYHSGGTNNGTPTEDRVSFHLAQGLAGLMLVGLIAWILNFTISVFRLAEKLGGIDD
ncbi:Uu.00g049710.m01.CDS01 [Anthostomella pinea]|uniref:Uu.00g049710.m01.CDS01 n=1 Tax=Anthostomella pinea TaxID=933095 RepID=A0AAI8V6X7_9PEZI|nr:Uu.00g049710.m01.CDS01 [Anthostomella pinea]